MKTIKCLCLSALLAACAPAGEVPRGSAPPPGCLTNVPCERDDDCGTAQRCNRALAAPMCQNLRCAPNGSTCWGSDGCESRTCSGSSTVVGAERVCVAPLTEVGAYELCEGEVIGAPCGPLASLRSDSQGLWYCRRDLGLVGGAAYCGGGGGRNNDECPPGPNGEPSSYLLLNESSPSFACYFNCVNGTCPTGYQCTSVRSHFQICLPSPVR